MTTTGSPPGAGASPGTNVPPDADRIAVDAQVHRRRAEGDHVLEPRQARDTQIHEVQVREAEVVAGRRGTPQGDEAILRGDAGKRVQQHRLHPAEDGGVRADAETEDEDGDGRESGSTRDQTPGGAQVVNQHAEAPGGEAEVERVRQRGQRAREQPERGARAAHVRPGHPERVVPQVRRPLIAPRPASVGRDRHLTESQPRQGEAKSQPPAHHVSSGSRAEGSMRIGLSIRCLARAADSACTPAVVSRKYRRAGRPSR